MVSSATSDVEALLEELDRVFTQYRESWPLIKWICVLHSDGTPVTFPEDPEHLEIIERLVSYASDVKYGEVHLSDIHLYLMLTSYGFYLCLATDPSAKTGMVRLVMKALIRDLRPLLSLLEGWSESEPYEDIVRDPVKLRELIAGAGVEEH